VESAAAVAAAVIDVLTERGARSLLVAHDARQLGASAARRIASAAAARAEVALAPLLPTPTAGFAVRAGHYDAAVLVTASHNPADWNGVKVRVAPGVPPDPATESAVERAIASRGAGSPGGAGGTGPAGGRPGARTLTAAEVGGLVAEHHRHARQCCAGDLRRAAPRPRVVVDGLSGVAGAPMSRLCRQLGWDVRAFGTEPDPAFGGLVPDPTRAGSRQRARERVLEQHADFGVVLDGDGDRIWLVDDRGDAIEPHHLFALLLTFEHDRGALPADATVAATVSSGSVVAQVCASHGYRLVHRPVGFKHIAPLLVSAAAAAGTGTVGDHAFAAYSADRDPSIVVSLLDGLLRSSGTARPAELKAMQEDRYGATSWQERHVRSAPADSAQLAAVGHRCLARLGARVTSVTALDGVRFAMDEPEWLLLRQSTTENGVRVFSEMRDPRRQRALLDCLTATLTDPAPTDSARTDPTSTREAT